MHYDTGLYHAQAIRWIEEYGVVPGLANLHSRFGYNSASFALSAFFSETWLIGRPMHCVAGFFALLCACKCAAGLMAFWKRKKVRISDFLSIGGIFYLIAVFREMVSPASDYFAMLVLFWVIMTWVELWEQERDCPIGEKQTVPYALLSLYLVYAATVKLSTAVILLLVLYPAVLLLRQKKMAADCRLYCAGTSDCISVSGAECADFRLAVLSVYVFGLVSGRLENFQRLCGQRRKGNPGICAGDLQCLSAGSAVEAVAAELVCSAGWIR